MYKNEHLIPINILQLIERLEEKYISDNEKAVILVRLEAVRDVTTRVVEKYRVETGQRQTK